MEHRQRPVEYLPSIGERELQHSSSRCHAESPPAPPLSLPHLAPAVTKAEQYVNLKQFDEKGLKRSKEHTRNALKTTDNLKQIEKCLREQLKTLERKSKNKVSFDRLTVYRDAFEAIVKASGAFSPLLQDIKDMYNQYLVMTVSQQKEDEPKAQSTDTLSLSSSLSPNDAQRASPDLHQLKKQLHHMEVESRVLLQENNRLRDELSKEKERYGKRKQEEMAAIELLKSQPNSPSISLTGVQDYASQVESLQLQIAEEKQAIAKIISTRKGKIPLSVCHNLEQCLREVEIETQKCQRHREHLLHEIEKWKGALWEQLQKQGCSDHLGWIWDTIIVA